MGHQRAAKILRNHATRELRDNPDGVQDFYQSLKRWWRRGVPKRHKRRVLNRLHGGPGAPRRKGWQDARGQLTCSTVRYVLGRLEPLVVHLRNHGTSTADERPLTDLSRDELLTLGFRDWDGSGLLLIPRGLFDRVPKGTELRSIMGRTAVVGVDRIDMDTRYGLLAYGWVPSR